MRFGKVDGGNPAPPERSAADTPASLKAGRKRRRKAALAALVAAILMVNIPPFIASEVPEITSPSSTYGVNDALAALQNDKSTRIDTPDILRQTRMVLDGIQPQRIEKSGPATDYRLVEPVLPNMSAPGIFDEAENNTALNGTSVIQFLIDQPLNFWVHTSSGGIQTWTKGLLRPSLDFTVDATGIHLVDWERWVEVDADQNASTGDVNGNELRARFSIVVENYTFDRPTLLPFNPDWSFNFTGGIRLEVQRLTNTTAAMPMEVSFLKAFMYRGFNYVWMTSFDYSNMPTTFELRLVAEKVRAGGGLREIIGSLLQNFSLGNLSLLKDISGPYKAEIHSSPLESLGMTIGYAKADNMLLVERSWARLGLGRAPGHSVLPQNMELWLDSPSFNVSFNKARWTADAPCTLDAQLAENQENTTFATIQIRELPTYFYIQIDRNSTGGLPDSYIHFESSTSISYLEYDEFELYGGNATEYRHMHARIEDLPTELTLTGTFEVGGPQQPAISNPIGIGIIPKILDNLMTRFAGKFSTFARTLRTIPENALHMSEKGGWMKLEVPQGQQIGSIEIRMASGPYIDKDGSFLAFYNLSQPEAESPALGVSFSLRLDGIFGLDSDFRQGTRLDIRTAVKQRFAAVFIDRNREANASLEISSLPTELVLDINRDSHTLGITSSEKITSITYLGWVRQQYLKMTFTDLPSSLKVTQKGDQFGVDTPADQPLGRMEILSTDSDLYELDGNYLAVRSGTWGTSFGAAFQGLTHAGYSTGTDGKLELCLTSPDPMRIFIENETEMMKARLSIAPMPRSISIGMSNLLTSGGLKVPDILNATSVLGFSSAVFAITELGADVLAIASQVAGFVDQQMAGLGANSTFGIRTDSDTILVGDIQKGNITEAPWTHGITSRHLEMPGKNLTYYNTKLFLRLARETLIASHTQGDAMNFSLEMKGFRPMYDWMLIDLEGIAQRDISAYLTGIQTPVDFRLDANLTQNATYGREVLKADMGFHASKPLGPFIASLARAPPLSTRVLAFAAGLPADMQLSAYMAERLELKYKASDEMKYLYIKNSRLVNDRWRASTILMHDIPATVEVALSPPEHFEATAGPVQMLPDFTVSADRDLLDIFVVLDGLATGQRTSYQMEVKNAGRLTSGSHSGDVYRLRGSGADEVYVRAWNMPYRKGLSISALGLFVEDLRSLDLKVSMVFGSYPMFQMSSVSAGSINLSVRAKMSFMGSDREGKMVFADSRSAGGIPMGLQFFTNGMSVGASDGAEHTLVPMPLASLLSTLFGG